MKKGFSLLWSTKMIKYLLFSTKIKAFNDLFQKIHKTSLTSHLERYAITKNMRLDDGRYLISSLYSLHKSPLGNLFLFVHLTLLIQKVEQFFTKNPYIKLC